MMKRTSEVGESLGRMQAACHLQLPTDGRFSTSLKSMIARSHAGILARRTNDSTGQRFDERSQTENGTSKTIKKVENPKTQKKNSLAKRT